MKTGPITLNRFHENCLTAGVNVKTTPFRQMRVPSIPGWLKYRTGDFLWVRNERWKHRAESRGTLAIHDVAVERLHDITSDGAYAEGINALSLIFNDNTPPNGIEAIYQGAMMTRETRLYGFRCLWERAHGKGSWAKKTDVVVLSYLHWPQNIEPCIAYRASKSTPLRFICDQKRHLICEPYSIENLHRMAELLCIGRHWFHAGDKAHYDIPLRRETEIKAKCEVVSPRDLLQIITAATTPIDTARAA